MRCVNPHNDWQVHRLLTWHGSRETRLGVISRESFIRKIKSSAQNLLLGCFTTRSGSDEDIERLAAAQGSLEEAVPPAALLQ